VSPAEFALRDDILRHDAVDALFTWLLGQECQAELLSRNAPYSSNTLAAFEATLM